MTQPTSEKNLSLTAPSERLAERIRVRMDADVNYHNGVLLQFIEELPKNDPAYTMEWMGDRAFESAAKRKIALLVLAWLSAKNGGPAVALKELRKVLLFGARAPKRSTSPSANLAHQAEVAAAAEFVSDWEERIERALAGEGE